MIPYSRPKLSDLYTLSLSKLLENHTLHSGTYLYSPYMAVPPPPPPGFVPTLESLRYNDGDGEGGEIVNQKVTCSRFLKLQRRDYPNLFTLSSVGELSKGEFLG